MVKNITAARRNSKAKSNRRKRINQLTLMITNEGSYPLKLLFAELLAIGIGRVHDLSPLGGLHGGRSSTKKGGLGHEKRGEEAHRSVREIVIEAQ